MSGKIARPTSFAWLIAADSTVALRSAGPQRSVGGGGFDSFRQHVLPAPGAGRLSPPSPEFGSLIQLFLKSGEGRRVPRSFPFNLPDTQSDLKIEESLEWPISYSRPSLWNRFSMR